MVSTFLALQERLDQLAVQQKDMGKRLSHLEVASSGILSKSTQGVLHQQLRGELRKDVNALEARLSKELEGCQNSATMAAKEVVEVRLLPAE
jgi:hypothetical protein